MKGECNGTMVAAGCCARFCDGGVWRVSALRRSSWQRTIRVVVVV